MQTKEVDLTDPATREAYRKHYAKRYAETAGEKEYVRKDKAHWYAFMMVRDGR